MKALKWIGGILGVYVVFVFLFETFFLGMYQPKLEGTGIPMLVLTTTDASGETDDRRLARLVTDDKIYVSAHHWPRAWYGRAVANPDVRAEIDGIVAKYRAVPVDGEEFERVAAEFPLPLPILVLMGFPPEREILRLDPVMWPRRNGR